MNNTQRIFAADAKRTKGTWGIGYINDDKQEADIISVETGEVIAEGVALHNALFISLGPNMVGEVRKNIGSRKQR